MLVWRPGDGFMVLAKISPTVTVDGAAGVHKERACAVWYGCFRRSAPIACDAFDSAVQFDAGAVPEAAAQEVQGVTSAGACCKPP